MSSDLTFLTNEPGNSLRDRFSVLLGGNTRFFDCLAGYFFISGFYKLYPALENVEKIRILIGLRTDRTVYELLERAGEQGELPLKSHALVKEQIPQNVLVELEKAPCPIHISPFRAERIVFHTDGLLHVYQDQILVERGECRFCVVVSNTGLFFAVEMIGVELNGLFGLLDLPVGNVFQGLEILQKSSERLCRISILQAF